DMATPVGPAAPADTVPPSKPGTLTAAAAAPDRVGLVWGGAAGDTAVRGYEIERCQGGGCSDFVHLADSQGTSYSDTTVSAQTSYSYRVRAGDAAATLCSCSNTATTATPALRGLVAAYGFEEGSGTGVADASGVGNDG